MLVVCCAMSSAVAQNTVPPVDTAAAARGAGLYGTACASCHGKTARGTTTAPDLIRSTAVLHDRFGQLHGKEFPEVLSKAPHKGAYSSSQLADLSQFLTQSVNKILRSGYSNQPVNMLTGDAKAGETYFNHDGGCSKCHSTTGDLAGVGKRYSAATLQQKFLFPNSGIRGLGTQGAAPPVKTQVSVATPSGKYEGTLVRLDDFDVSLRDKGGHYRSFERSANVTVVVDDPFAAHIALLDKYSDKNIHDLLAYLVTIK